MRVLALGAALLTVTCIGAALGDYTASWRAPDTGEIVGYVLNCATGNGREAVPCGGVARPLQVINAPGSDAAGGLGVYRVNSPAGAGGLIVKAGPGRLYSFNLCNTAGAGRYVRFYNTVAPIPGTTPVYAGPIVVSAGSCQPFTSSVGLSFGAGIGLGITAANGDADATAISAGDVVGFLGFQ